MHFETNKIRVEEHHVPDARPVKFVTPQKETPPKDHHHLFTLLIGIVIGILVSAILGGVYYMKLENQPTAPSDVVTVETKKVVVPTKSVDLTENWKSFGLQDQYKLKLPSEWKEFQKSQPYQLTNYDINTAAGRSFDPGLDKGKLKIEIYTEDISNTSESLADYVAVQRENYLQEREGTTDSMWNETQLTVGGQQAIKVQTTSPGFVVYTMHPSGLSIISIAFALDFDNYEKLSDEILSTFTFVTPSEESEMTPVTQ